MGKPFVKSIPKQVPLSGIIDGLLEAYYPSGASQDQQELKMEIINRISPTMVFVVDFSTRGYHYVSENIKDILGIHPQELMEDGLAKGIKLFSEDHRNIFSVEILQVMFDWFTKLVEQGLDATKSKMTYNINMVNREGYDISTMHIIKPLTLTEQGMPCLAVKYITDISHHKTTVQPDIKLEYRQEDNLYKTLYNKTFHVPADTSFQLSNREQEIMDLIKKGLSSKEIAEKLHLSLHTVNNHRKNMAKKYNVKSLHHVPIGSVSAHL